MSRLKSNSEAQPGWRVSCAFAPDAARAAGLDVAVRAGLADSLKTLFESLDAPGATEARSRAALLRRVEAGPVPPGLFGLYIELVLALFTEQDAAAADCLQALLQPWPAASDALRIVTLDDADLGPGQSARYRRLLRDDIACEMRPLAAEARDPAAARLNTALDLMQAGEPDLFGEFSALIREVVLVSPEAGPDGLIFAGVSTFSLWGALMLNADQPSDRLDLVISLAHEAGHSCLFGLALGGRLTENDDSELYPSPLRRDPRPMEGVAHATFVAARMAYAILALLGSGRLDEAETKRAADQLSRNQAACRRGLAIVAAKARLTPVGAAVFAELRAYASGLG